MEIERSLRERSERARRYPSALAHAPRKDLRGRWGEAVARDTEHYPLRAVTIKDAPRSARHRPTPRPRAPHGRKRSREAPRKATPSSPPKPARPPARGDRPDFASQAQAAKDRLAAVHKGEVVGGIPAPMTAKDILRITGMTKAELRRCEQTAEIAEHGWFQMLLDEVMRRHQAADRATVRDLHRLLVLTRGLMDQG